MKAGGFYGWPYCYTTQPGQAQVWDRDFGKKTADACKAATPAFSLTTAHSAPLGLAFYDGKTFPAAYRGQMFAALHGSWNRSARSGYKVIMIDPQSGKTTDFVTGFLKGQTVAGVPSIWSSRRTGPCCSVTTGRARLAHPGPLKPGRWPWCRNALRVGVQLRSGQRRARLRACLLLAFRPFRPARPAGRLYGASTLTAG